MTTAEQALLTTGVSTKRRRDCRASSCCCRDLLPQHDQRIGAIRPPPPPAFVGGPKAPDVAAVRYQPQFAALQPPHGRRKRRDRRVAMRLEKYREIVRRRLGIGQGQAADRLAVAVNHRPVADHLVHRFRERTRGDKILQDVDALAGTHAFENSALDFGKVDHRLPRGILQPHNIQSLDVPGRDILGERQRRGAAGLKFKLQPLRPGIAFQRDDAGLAAFGGRQLPLADHVFFQRGRILRPRRRYAIDRRQQRREHDAGATTCHQRPFAGVSATGVSGGFPANQAFRLSTTNWSMAFRVTTDAEPICGSSTTFCIARSSSGTFGSLSNTSSPAARMVPDLSAAIKAGSSTTEPRATLMTTPRGPSALRTSALIIFAVAPPPGTMITSVSTAFAISIRSG